MSRVALWLGLSLLWALLWLTLWRSPAAPSADLDPSWQLTLAYAAIHHLQFGTEIVFTYGPLGYLLGATNIGELHLAHLAWQLGAGAVFAAALLSVARPFRRRGAWLAYAFFLLLLAPYSDLVQMAFILVVSAMLLRRDPPFWLAGMIVAALAVLALIKFTNLLLIGVALTVAIGWHAGGRRWSTVGVIVGGFAVVFALCWVACGQQLAHIFPFIANSYAVTAGYAGAMALYESPLMLTLGLITSVSLAACYVLAVAFSADRARAAALVLIAAAASFLNWKHGFTRADAHVLAHFVFSLFVALIFVALFPEAWGKAKRLLACVLVVGVAAAIGGIYLAAPDALKNAPAAWAEHLSENLGQLVHLGASSELARERYRQMRDGNSLPAVTALVGDKSVDVLGHEQAYAIFNQLNFRPRPVFQSYSAYSDDLLRLNEAYYRSADAPDFVLQKIQTIDGRLVTADDSLVVRQLYRHYTHVADENGFLVWQKNPTDPKLDRSTPLALTAVAFGEAVPVPVADDDPIWVEIEVHPTLLGQLRNLLYKPPLLSLTTTDGAGFKTSYRFIADMGRAGFLAAPVLPNNYEIAKYQAGGGAERFVKLSVDLPTADRKYFQPQINFRFSALAPFPRGPALADPAIAATTRVFHREPTKIVPSFPVQSMQEGGREVLFAHPACELIFALDAHDHRVRGGCGFVAAAYAPPNRTDGAEFALLWTTPDGATTPLWHRLLQPAENSADRGRQNFDVTVPAGAGRLIFRTTSGPNHDRSCDWTYWTDVTFTD